MADFSQPPYPTGWIDDDIQRDRIKAQMPYPVFAQAAPHLIQQADQSDDVFLYKAWKEVNGGSYIPYPAQAIGDCVSMGFGHGIDLLAAIQIAVAKKNEVFKQTATEAVYAAARVDIGGDHSYSDGAVGAWAAQAVTKIGTLSREVVGSYSGKRAKRRGHDGVPANLKAQMGDHKVAVSSCVTTWLELKASMNNLQPVPVCSNYGFTMTRDSEGFCAARGTWNHCMLIVGIRGGSRPGACIFQSWGFDTPSGPLDLEQPPNSFWVDKRIVERMLAQQDSWTLSNFNGYPGQKLPDRWTYAGLFAA